jgi:hypothetical protein
MHLVDRIFRSKRLICSFFEGVIIFIVSFLGAEWSKNAINVIENALIVGHVFRSCRKSKSTGPNDQTNPRHAVNISRRTEFYTSTSSDVTTSDAYFRILL